MGTYLDAVLFSEMVPLVVTCFVPFFFRSQILLLSLCLLRPRVFYLGDKITQGFVP